MSRRSTAICLCLTVFVFSTGATTGPTSKPSSALIAPNAVIKDYRTAVRALRKIDSDVQIGISFADYHSRLLDAASDAKAAMAAIIVDFGGKKTDTLPGPFLEVTEAESSYESADELWRFYFRMREASDYQAPENEVSVDGLSLDMLRATMNDSPENKAQYDCLSQLPTINIGGQDYIRLSRALSCYWNAASTLLAHAEAKIAMLKPSR